MSNDASPNDPLNLFPAFGEFRRHPEVTFCDGPDHSPDCHCQKLEDLYGPRWYYCRKLPCRGYLTGFATKAAREDHIESHSQDFKCPVEDCYAASGGLDSTSIRSRHMVAYHGDFNGADNGMDHLRTLHDAIRAGNLPTLQTLLASGSVTIPKRHEYLHTLSLAARHSTSSILTFLLDPDLFAVYTPPLPLPLLRHRRPPPEPPQHPPPPPESLRRPPPLCTLGLWNPARARHLPLRRIPPPPPRRRMRGYHPAGPPRHGGGGSLFNTPHLCSKSVEEVHRRFRDLREYLPTPAAGEGA